MTEKPPLLSAFAQAGIPPLKSTPDEEDPTVHARFVARWSNCSWYVIEFDGEDRCFGLMSGEEVRFAYFDITELQAIRGPDGLVVEQDATFVRKPLSRVYEDVTSLGAADECDIEPE